MKLETARSIHQENAGPDDIRSAIASDSLRGEFIILSAGDHHYIQAAGDTEPFTLEYREGGESEHYECAKDVSSSELESAFLGYLSGDPAWKSAFEWKKIEQRPWWKLW